MCFKMHFNTEIPHMTEDKEHTLKQDCWSQFVLVTGSSQSQFCPQIHHTGFFLLLFPEEICLQQMEYEQHTSVFSHVACCHSAFFSFHVISHEVSDVNLKKEQKVMSSCYTKLTSSESA